MISVYRSNWLEALASIESTFVRCTDAQSGKFNTRNTEGYLADGVIINVPVVLAVAVVVGEAVTYATEFLMHPVQQLNNRTQ